MKIMLTCLFFSIFFIVCDGAKDVKKGEEEDGSRSYIANLKKEDEKFFEALRQEKEVNTVWDDPALKANASYRKLVYDSLTSYGQKRHELLALFPDLKLSAESGYNVLRPELVMLVNRQPMCAGPVELGGQVLRGIEFQVEKENKNLFGYTRLTFLHEITHLSEKHYYQSCDITTRQPVFSQNQERMADFFASLVGQCEICSRESAQYYFDLYRPHRKSYGPLVFTSLDEIDSMDMQSLNKVIMQAQAISMAGHRDHPIDLERALKFIRNAKDPKYKIVGSKCKYHKQFGGGLTTEQMFKKIADEHETEKKRRIKEIEDRMAAAKKKHEEFKKAKKIEELKGQIELLKKKQEEARRAREADELKKKNKKIQ